MPTPKKYANAAQRQAAYRLRCKERGQATSTRSLRLCSGLAGQTTPRAPGHRRWKAMNKQALCLIEQVAREMETHYDARSDTWRDSERGEAFAEVMESVAEAAAMLREISSQ